MGEAVLHIGQPWRNAQPGVPADNLVANTKYTLLSFVPRNLVEQFGRFTNMYFLIIAVLQMWGRITPVNPATTWVPLFVIFSVTAIKEGYDDVCRHRRDRWLNQRRVLVLSGGRVAEMQSQQIRAGDVVVVEEGDEVPCDLALLATSKPTGNCYVETAALDGETDLKVRCSPPCCAGLGLEDLVRLQGVVRVAPPDHDCHAFRGSIAARVEGGDEAVQPLGLPNTLFQGCHLRHTAWAAGLAVYVGNRTKLGLCQGAVPSKLARADVRTDRFTACVFCGQLLVVLVMGTAGNAWQQLYAGHMPYLQLEPGGWEWSEWLVIPLRFLLLCSIAVTMDAVKVFYALLISQDERMTDPATRGHAVANNTSISEDLGQVGYLLSDKTGTLTENCMSFKYLFLGSHHYGGHGGVPLTPRAPHQQVAEGEVSAPGPSLGEGAIGDKALRAMVRSALEAGMPEDAAAVGIGTDTGAPRGKAGAAGLAVRVMALCNSALPHRPEEAGAAWPPSSPVPQAGQGGGCGRRVDYMTASPDEEVLVTTAAELGATLLERTGARAVLRAGLRTEEYELLAALDFTSERRCMSVLVRPAGWRNLLLLTKGADDVILGALADGQDGAQRAAAAALEVYASCGLRTLCLAARVVPLEEHAAWAPTWAAASTQLQGREEAVAAACRRLEHSLHLLGVTAIEDRLQPGVPQTVQLLKEAGIAVWMLTGDRLSTAVQLGKASGLVSCNPSAEMAVISGGSEAEVGQQLRSVLDRLADPLGFTGDINLVVDGAALASALAHHPDTLLQAAQSCAGVLFCRVTPSQKAAVVRLVKRAGGRRGAEGVVAAVGDGGNDVAMIQAADVGVGIAGREGQQAARAADFAIPSFRCLGSLILVHGRLSLQRTSVIAIYCVYKSVMLCFMQLLFAGASGLSGTSFHSSFALMAYNVAFTLAPSLSFALDRDAEPSRLLQQPHLFRATRSGRPTSYEAFGTWVLLAMYHSSVAYFVMRAALGNAASGPRQQVGGDMELMSLAAYSATIWINACVVTMQSHAITVPQALATWAMVPLFYALSAAVSAVPRFGMYGVAGAMLAAPAYWLALPPLLLLAAAPMAAFYLWDAGVRAAVQRLLQQNQARLLRWRRELSDRELQGRDFKRSHSGSDRTGVLADTEVPNGQPSQQAPLLAGVCRSL
eukprot:jgi/Tetstr1/436463/TSEL_025291.t1